MNKKGIGFIGIIGLFSLIFVVMILAMVQTDSGFTYEKFNNSTKVLNWSNFALEPKVSNYSNGDYYCDVIFTIAFKYVDILGYTAFEIVKVAGRFAFEHPDIINYKVLFVIIFLSLLAPLIYPAFLILVSLILLIQEWFQLRRERKTKDESMDRQRRK